MLNKVLLEWTAPENTDIYQYAGMKKVICISEFEQNIIYHLPNNYATGKLGRDKLGSDHERMREALQRLLNAPVVNR
ncbi:MAG: hypothetical protein MUE95_03125 [Cyclobacteriaceae bacterium]|jgi:hypothetical protein|nr:hypothetical protein [Cyclobacteriaceae bacterium]